MNTSFAEPTKRALLIGIDEYINDSHIQSLKGCKHDVERLADTLCQHYGFPQDRVKTLVNEQATREKILAGLDRLAEETQPGDVVVVSYHGHGSQALDGDGDEADGMDETIVPHDSSRAGQAANRDITDDELYEKFLGLRQRTDQLTVIFDCCHSGSATREVGPCVRQVAPAPRLLQGRRGLPKPRPSVLRTAAGAIGYEYVFLAACRDAEKAAEACFDTEHGLRNHGALTYYLTKILREVAILPGITWRDVFERLCIEMRALVGSRQQPQIEGATNHRLFNSGKSDAWCGGLITERRGDHAVLNLGALAGVRPGCEFLLYPPKWDGDLAAQTLSDLPPPIARLVIGPAWNSEIAVEPGCSCGQIVDEKPSYAVRAGCRALLLSVPGAQFKLCVALAPHPSLPETLLQAAWGASMASRLLQPLPQSVGDGITVVVRLPGERSSSAADWLGEVEQPSWVLTQNGVDLVCPPIPLSQEAAAQKLCGQLERIARLRQIKLLQNPGSELLSQVQLLLMRKEDSRWGQAQPGASGLPEYDERDDIALAIRNQSPKPLYFALLMLCDDHLVEFVYPPSGSGGAEALSSGRSLIVGKDTRDCYSVQFPDELPLTCSELRQTWILVVSTQPVDVNAFQQRSSGPNHRVADGVLNRIASVFDDQAVPTAMPPSLRAAIAKRPNSDYEDWASLQQVCLVKRRMEHAR